MKDLKLNVEEDNFALEELKINNEELSFDSIDINIPNVDFDINNVKINWWNASDEKLKQMCLDACNKVIDLLIKKILSWTLSYKETKKAIRLLAKMEWIHVWRAKKWYKGQITEEEEMALNRILEKRWIKK